MIYLLHSTVPLTRAGGLRVQHYLGWCREGNLAQRLHDHRMGHNTSKIVRAFLLVGGTLMLTALWTNTTRADERRLKTLGHLRRHCRVCNPDLADRTTRAMPRRYRPRGS